MKRTNLLDWRFGNFFFALFIDRSTVISRLIALISLLFIGCRPSSTSRKGQPPVAPLTQLRLQISSDPLLLDPRKANDGNSGTILRMIYEGLTRLDSNGKPQNALAESIEVIDDYNIKFKLREAYWTNGDPITSADFQRTWSSVLHPKFAAENAYQLFPIKNARAIKYGELSPSALGVELDGDREMRIELENPTPYFLELLAFDSFFPHHSKTEFVSKKNAIPTITCGPFKLDSWKLQNELVLRKNPHYWDARNVHVDDIRISVIKDPGTPLFLFEEGELDYLGSPLSALTQEEIAAQRLKGTLKSMRGACAYWFMLNTSRPPFTNKKVRQAFARSLNRHLLKCVLEDGFTPAYWFLPPSLRSGNPPLIRDESMSRARELFMEGLDELGMRLEDCEISLIYNQSHLHRRVAQIVQQQWQQALGVKMHLTTMDWAEFNRRLKRKDFLVARYGWEAQFNDPINFLEIFTSSQAISGYNFTGWENEEYDQLIAGIRKTGNAGERRRLIADAEALLMREMPVIPVFFQTFCYLQSPRLKGVVLTPNGKIDFRWAYFQDQPNPSERKEL